MIPNKQAQDNLNQQELNKMLSALTSSEGTHGCLFNLLIYTQDERRTLYFAEMVKMIRTQFPCRIIFITANPKATENLFHVYTQTEKNPDGTGFLCDQVFIEAAGQDIQRIYFLLLTLFVPDLPIYLIWGQDPTVECTLLPHLEHFATRLIFDAETTDDLQQFCRDMLSRMDSSPIQVVDMNWARIQGWREVVAQIFDSQERLEQLAHANTIEFIYKSHPSALFLHPKTQAIYLQGWLASRLKWQFLKAEKENGFQVIYYQSHDPVDFQSNNQMTHPDQTGTPTQNLPPKKVQIRRIQLTPISNPAFESEEILGMSVSGDHDYNCTITRITPDQVKVHASNQSQCELPFVLLMPTLRSGRSFMQEIFYQKMSDQYASILHLISLTRWS